VPALPNVPKVVRIDEHFVLGADQNAMWRTFWQYSGTLNNTDANVWAADIFAAWHAGGSFAPQTSPSTSHVKTELTDLSTNSSPQAIITGSNAGTAGGGALAAGTAMVISFKTARRYRGGHPRIYIPGIPSAMLQTAQTWFATSMASMLSAFATYASAVETNLPSAGGTATQVNVSYFQGFTNVTFPSGRIRPVPKLRSAGPVVDLIVNAFVNPNVASQRRRNQQA
jgi:hypothetical protein